jgi:hypothetical protein
MHKNGHQQNKGGNMTVGMKVEHVFTKDWLYVLDIAKNQGTPDKILCRTKDLREVWFYDFELKQIG